MDIHKIVQDPWKYAKDHVREHYRNRYTKQRLPIKSSLTRDIQRPQAQITYPGTIDHHELTQNPKLPGIKQLLQQRRRQGDASWAALCGVVDTHPHPDPFDTPEIANEMYYYDEDKDYVDLNPRRRGGPTNISAQYLVAGGKYMRKEMKENLNQYCHQIKSKSKSRDGSSNTDSFDSPTDQKFDPNDQVQPNLSV